MFCCNNGAILNGNYGRHIFPPILERTCSKLGAVKRRRSDAHPTHHFFYLPSRLSIIVQKPIRVHAVGILYPYTPAGVACLGGGGSWDNLGRDQVSITRLLMDTGRNEEDQVLLICMSETHLRGFCPSRSGLPEQDRRVPCFRLLVVRFTRPRGAS